MRPSFKSHDGFLGTDHFALPNIGLGIIAAVLLGEGHRVIIRDPQAEGIGFGAMLEFLRAEQPDILGLSVVSMDFSGAVRLGKAVREHLPATRIILGGPHFHNRSDALLDANPWFDFLVVGEGDHTLSRLIAGGFREEACADIPGLVYRNTAAGRAVANGLSVVEDLDALPLPAYHLYPKPLQWYRPAVNNYKRLPNAAIITSRGCPSKCIYCQGSLYRRMVRSNSPDYVLKHIRLLMSEYGIRDLLFFDDVFTLNRRRLLTICDAMIRDKFDLTWGCFVKINRVIDQDVLLKMKQAGCWLIMPGIESGSEAVLDLLGKHQSMDEVRRICHMADQLRIQVRPSFMLGVPGETRETLQQTIDLALSLPVTHIGITYFSPLPGTPVWDNAEQYGAFQRDNTDAIHTTSARIPFVPHGLERKDLEHQMDRLYARFYFRFSWLWRQFRYLDGYEAIKLLRGLLIALRLRVHLLRHGRIGMVLFGRSQ